MLSSASPLSDWLTWLETHSPTEINLGLDRVQRVLDELSLTLANDVLLIAGTNGKGSSVVMADALLRASGKRVGAYTSPHISRYNERIVVDGEAVDDATIIAGFQAVEAARGDLELTYFEFGTLAAAVIFAEADVDVWLLEVGLGGRLDATNAFEPSASLITNVSLDHCDWLGDDVETIALEKAGVMRSGKPTVFGSRTAPGSLLQKADEIGALLLKAGSDFDCIIDEDGCWNWRSPSVELKELTPPGLQGAFQIENAAAVMMLLEAAGLADDMDAAFVNRVLPGLFLAGRLQTLQVLGTQWIFDVAHNPAAAEVLAETLELTDFTGETIAIVGLLEDKDLEGVITPLLTIVDRWIAIAADSSRALPANELARLIANLSGHACLVASSATDAIEFARRSGSENDRILVTGSFFTVAPVIDKLNPNLQPK
jgi:dihydrofolate synthase/folylpolyglutamate synthase